MRNYIIGFFMLVVLILGGISINTVNMRTERKNELDTAFSKADRKCELCRKNGSAEAVYYIEEKGIREQIITEKEWGILKESKKKRNWREAYQKVVDRGIQMAVRGQNNYPKRFEELAGMPYALFFIGEMPREGMPSVAVVGARRCSSYGEKMTLRFVERLAESGIQIISGMALGDHPTE